MSRHTSQPAPASSSLSSVVQNLVRHQFGASAMDVPATDLDDYVANMLVKEAQERKEKWQDVGTSAYLSDDEDNGGRPQRRTNKRFLVNMMKNVDDHNQALLRQEQEAAAQSKTRSRGDTRPRSLFAMAKNDMGTGSSRLTDKRKEREPSRAVHRQGKDRDSRSSRRFYSDDDEDLRGSSRKDRSPPSRSIRHHENDCSDSADERYRSHRSRRERSESRSRTREAESSPRRRHRDLDDSKGDRQERRRDRSRDSRKRSRYESEDDSDHERDRSRKSRRRKHDELEDRPSRSSKDKYRERSPLEVAEKAPPSEMIGGPHTGPSKMDKYFTQDYDPRLDVSLDTLTDPSTGLIGEGNFDEWSAMLDILKIRRQEKNYLAAERAERDRDAKYSSSKKTSSTKIPATTYDEANKAILTMGGYAKTKKGTEWGKGPDLSF